MLDVIEVLLEEGETICIGEPYYISHGEDYLLFLSGLRHETWLEDPVESWMIDFLRFETLSDIADYDFMASAEEIEEHYFDVFD